MACSQNGAVKARRKPARRRPQSAAHVMGDAAAGDIAAMRAEVADMIASLDERIANLNRLTKRGASHAATGANDIVLNAISGLTGRATQQAQAVMASASDEVAKFGTQTVNRCVREIDKRPLLLRPSAARKQTAADPELEGLSRDQRIAMVFEALMLGFSMGSRKPAESTDNGK